MIDIEFAHLHNPVFVAHDNGGTNFGEKLHIDAKRNKAPLEALYLEGLDVDGVKQIVLTVVYKGTKTHIQNWNTVTPAKEKKASLLAQVNQAPIGPIQVNTPISMTPKKPGRLPKFQGEETQGE